MSEIFAHQHYFITEDMEFTSKISWQFVYLLKHIAYSCICCCYYMLIIFSVFGFSMWVLNFASLNSRQDLYLQVLISWIFFTITKNRTLKTCKIKYQKVQYKCHFYFNYWTLKIQMLWKLVKLFRGHYWLGCQPPTFSNIENW